MAHGHLPRGVLALGLVSLFMDLSSEMIHSLLPVFMVTVLGASIIAGSLLSFFGPAITFYADAAFSFVALAGLLADTRKTTPAV